MYKHILISTDGSEVARKGVDHGLSLAKSVGAKVTIVMATERWLIYAGAEWIPGPTEMAEYEARQKEGATTVLAETADQRHCNLIVMASHGRRGLRRLLLGSQTSEVLVSSPVPVLVVR